MYRRDHWACNCSVHVGERIERISQLHSVTAAVAIDCTVLLRRVQLAGAAYGKHPFASVQVKGTSASCSHQLVCSRKIGYMHCMLKVVLLILEHLLQPATAWCGKFGRWPVDGALTDKVT
jgi:hypothetical protein